MIAIAPPTESKPRSPRFEQVINANHVRLRRLVANALIPRPVPRPSKWIPKVVRLDKEREASRRVDFEGRPWWKDVVDAMWDAEVSSISVCAATQLGKTLMLICCILWCAENAPGPGMVVVPDRDAAMELRDRIYAHAEATIKHGKVKFLRIPPKRLWNMWYIDLGQMRVYLAWSGSQQRLRGRPCRYVWLTECDVYAKGSKQAGNPLDAAHQRTKAFFRGLHYHESSPSPEPSIIAEEEAKASARYRWQCQCPKCGLWQELRFFPHSAGDHAGKGGICGLKDEHGEYLHTEEARNKAHYVCRAGCTIGEELKQKMLESGRSVPLGCSIDADGNVTGEQPESRRSVGFQLWSVHSDTQSWGNLAAAYLEARESRRLPEYFGNWLGISFKRSSRVPTWQVLGKKLAWWNPKLSVPADAWFLTFGADVQEENNGVRYVVRAWGPWRTSWLVDWGWIDRVPGDETDLVKSDLRELRRRTLDYSFPVIGEDGRSAPNPLGRRDLTTRLGNIDSNFLPFKVHHWLRDLPHDWVYSETPRIRAVRGDHTLSMDTRYRKNIVETNTRSGEPYEGGLLQWAVNVYPYYDELLQTLAGEPNQRGSFHVTKDCLNLGRIYLEQICNFGPFTTVNAKTGLPETKWGPRKRGTPVDFWDCEIYAMVAAEMTVGDLGWDPEVWAKTYLKPPPAPEEITRRRKAADADSFGDR